MKMDKRFLFIIALWFVSLFFGVFPRKNYAANQSLTLMSYNILWKGQTDERLNWIAEKIKANQVDIVSFQESRGFKQDGPEWKPSWENVSGIEKIKRRLEKIGWRMPYLSSLEDRDVRVLSRFPIESYEKLDIKNSQTMVIKVGENYVPNGKIRVFNIHSQPVSQGCSLAQKLLEVAGEYDDYPQVLMGDFNCSSDFFGETDYMNTCKRCSDTVNDLVANRFREDPITYDYAVDYIIVESDSPWVVNGSVDTSNPSKCEVSLIPACSSDHYPVVAEILFKESNTSFTIQGLIKDCPLGSRPLLDGESNSVECEGVSDSYCFYNVVEDRHSVSLKLPDNGSFYDVYYSYCDCCTDHPQESYVNSSTHTFVRDSEGCFYDLWWKCCFSHDLDDDCKANSGDLKVLLSRFGTLNPEADLNGDRLVNGVDFGEMLLLTQ